MYCDLGVGYYYFVELVGFVFVVVVELGIEMDVGLVCCICLLGFEVFGWCDYCYVIDDVVL